MELPPELTSRVQAALAGAGDHERAVAQQRYMKSVMPYRGVTKPELKALLRPILKPWVPRDRTEWQETVLNLWDGASHREEWYAAIAVARHRAAAPWRDPASLELWRHLITTGAWWDVVDDVAQHLVGDTLREHRDAATPVLRRWAFDNDLWLRRTAVIAQVGHRPRVESLIVV